MTPKFKISKTDGIYVTNEWIINRHWLVSKYAVQLWLLQKKKAVLPLKPYLSFEDGKYEDGVRVHANPLDVKRLIPERDGYSPISLSEEAVVSSGGFVSAYVYKNSVGDRFGVGPTYVPLVACAQSVHGRKAELPLILLEADEIVGVVMPVRL